MFGVSWKRLFGISNLKSSIARATKIPTTKAGRKRKVDRIIASPLTGLFKTKKKRKSKGWF